MFFRFLSKVLDVFLPKSLPRGSRGMFLRFLLGTLGSLQGVLEVYSLGLFKGFWVIKNIPQQVSLKWFFS